MMPDEQLIAYRAASEAAAFADISDWGWIRLTGRDRLDLLHRLSTNDLKKLQPGQGAPTVLTSPTGRVMAVLTVYTGEADVFIRTMPGQAAGVTRYLGSMIFWQDQVEVADLTPAATQFALYGPAASSVLQSLTAEDISTLQPYCWRGATLSGNTVSVHRGGPLETFDWFLDVAPSGREQVLAALETHAARLDRNTMDLLRIEAGLPLWSRELSDQVTPLETGLLPAINFNKGCYTGQEVIARQSNYDKITRNLVGLEFDQEDIAVLVPPEPPAPGEPYALVRGPGRGGFVGSLAYSPRLGKAVGLAVVPRELAAPGQVVEVTRTDQTYQATVRSLPFSTPGSSEAQ